MAVPQLDTSHMPAMTGDNAAPPTPHQKSGRRLSKSVMRSDSQDAEGSKGWGMVVVRDGSGTERAVRVVQKAEAEDFNVRAPNAFGSSLNHLRVHTCFPPECLTTGESRAACASKRSHCIVLGRARVQWCLRAPLLSLCRCTRLRGCGHGRM